MTENDIPNWAERTLDRLDAIQRDISEMRTEGRLDRERLTRTEDELGKVRDELKPIVAHVGAVRIMFKWVIGLGGVASAVLAIVKLTSNI